MTACSIGEVTRRLGMSADTLRYYEKIGLLPRVARNGSLPHVSFELFPHFLELLAGKPRTDPAGIGQFAIHVIRQVEGPETGPGALRRAEPDHHEIVDLIGPHLQPVGRASC